jgi:hypothetical protein
LKKALPFEFVLDELAATHPVTRPMFGCIAIYVGEKIVLVLRQKKDDAADNGVWLATTQEHHASLQRVFPSMRSISLFGSGVTGWQVLPEGSSDFEESVLKACALIAQGDERIGKVPKPKKLKRAKAR